MAAHININLCAGLAWPEEVSLALCEPSVLTGPVLGHSPDGTRALAARDKLDYLEA